MKRGEAFGAKNGLFSHILKALKGLKSMHMGTNIKVFLGKLTNKMASKYDDQFT